MTSKQLLEQYYTAGLRFKQKWNVCEDNTCLDRSGTPMHNSWKKQREMIEEAVEDRIQKAINVLDRQDLADELKRGFEVVNPNTYI